MLSVSISAGKHHTHVHQACEDSKCECKALALTIGHHCGNYYDSISVSKPAICMIHNSLNHDGD